MNDQQFSSLMLSLDSIKRAIMSAGAIGRPAPGAAAPSGPPEVAPDSDLDSEYGNPTVKDPPKWDGESFTGSSMSNCSAEFLDSLAGFFDWQAMKDDEQHKTAKNGKPSSWYKRKDASRARGWAARIRNTGDFDHGANAPADDGFPL